MPSHSFKNELKDASTLYDRALRSIADKKINYHFNLLKDGAHIVRTRLSSLNENINSAKSVLLSSATNTLFVSRTHQFVDLFVKENILSDNFLSGLIEELREQSNLGLMTTNDLWAVPNSLSILLIRKIARSALDDKVYSEETASFIRASHFVLAEIQNVQWLEIMPKVSCLDSILAKDPDDIFISLDPETKDYYRQATARISRELSCSEKEVASKALELAVKHIGDQRHEFTHVGYYLVGRGSKRISREWVDIRSFVASLKYHESFRSAFLVLITLLFFASGYLAHDLRNFFSAKTQILVAITLWPALALLIFTSTVACVKYLLKKAFRTTRVPRLDYTKEIPLEARTLVVIPCLLIDKENISRLKERLLMQFLRNRNENVCFALLTDWADSEFKDQPNDLELLTFAIDSIRHLNSQHALESSKFFLFHRPRQWSAREKKWMGRSRKHGKLVDLNRYLATGEHSSFDKIIGQDLPESISYVITIDDDTDLSYGGAARLISAIHHPLNRPRLSSDGKNVVHGYGLLQPTVSVLGFNGNESRYQEATTNGVGIKIYQSSEPDFYTDVLDTGSFIGKGIYDVKCAHALLAPTIDPEVVLSHDIIEGGLLNSANISDTELFEPAPRSYGSEMKRQDRWIRGDAQNFFWLMTNPRKIAQLGAITTWRVIESLLNHLIEPALIAVALSAFGNKSLSWLALVVVAYAFIPAVLRSLKKVQAQKANFLKNSFGITLGSITRDFQIAFLKFSTLPHRTVVAITALARSFYRYFISGNYLLEWTAFELSEQSDSSKDLTGVFISGAIFALTCIFVCIGFPKTNVIVAILFSVVWFSSALYVHFLNSSQERDNRTRRDDLLLLAWRTWTYFDQAFKASSSKIVPDNVGDEDIDRRSSPTNIGMSLVAVVAANKLNLISRSTSLALLSDVLESIATLPTHQGHLFNWYDIDTLSVIGHGSISSADSANFVASVIVIKEWLGESLSDGEARDIANTYLNICSLLETSTSVITNTEASNSLRLLLVEIGNFGASSRSQMQDLIDSSSELEVNSEFHSAMLRGAEECLKAKAPLPNKIKIERLLQICEQLTSPSFAVFLNAQAGLLHIERNGSGPNNSPAMYDLLGSEARLATFIGVAKSDLQLNSWTRLSRSKIATSQGPCLVSWGGSLFEHLFAELFAQSPRGTLLDISNRNVVKKSIEAEHVYPWGKSECAYADESSNTVYGPVGEPELAINLERQRKKIIAPYASMLALNLETTAAIANLSKISQLNVLGEKGLFESISVSEVTEVTKEIMRRHFSHHQGMILASISNSCAGNITNLFMADREMRAASLLLREPWPDNFVLTN